MNDFLETRYPINREYRNDLFIFLFGGNKEFALSLYNAMNNTSYDDPEELIFNTIDDFIYIGRHNDVSFLIKNTINLYEHQTTINANIALRMFLYVAKLYEKYAFENNKVLYSSRLIRLPNPNFIVFYFGKEDQIDDRFIYLSEAMEIKNPNLELKVRVINANYGHNQHILNKCPVLYEYSWFLSEIRVRYNDDEKYIADNVRKMRSVVDEVLNIMPDSFIIKKIILIHKAEVANMLYTMEDEPRQMRLLEEEIRNEGRAEARAEGIETTIKILLKTGLSHEEAKRMAEEGFKASSEEFSSKQKNIKFTNILYTMEDEPRQMRLLEEEIRNEGRVEGRAEARAEDIEITIGLLMKTGLSQEEAAQKAQEAFMTDFEKQ